MVYKSNMVVFMLRRSVLLGIIWYLACLWHGCEHRGVADAEEVVEVRGLFAVPGLGRQDRVDTVVHNLRQLLAASIHPAQQQIITSSKISNNKSSFWTDKASELDYLSQHCTLVENPGKKVTENLYMIQPALMQRGYEYIFLLLDDIKIASRQEFDLSKMVEALHCNQLTVISPMIVGANKGGGQKFRNIMQTAPQSHSIGYVSSFVEIFAWVTTMPAYKALWELLCPEVNPYAWGYDFWYNGYARDVVSGHKMGIASSFQMHHEQDTSGSGAGRTDNTKVEDKWNAVIAQERHYNKHRNIKLGYYRKHFDITNATWNGAVKGYLQKCPHW